MSRHTFGLVKVQWLRAAWPEGNAHARDKQEALRVAVLRALVERQLCLLATHPPVDEGAMRGCRVTIRRDLCRGAGEAVSGTAGGCRCVCGHVVYHCWCQTRVGKHNVVLCRKVMG